MTTSSSYGTALTTVKPDDVEGLGADFGERLVLTHALRTKTASTQDGVNVMAGKPRDRGVHASPSGRVPVAAPLRISTL